MTRRILGPFNRVEGDLEVQFESDAGVITQAWVNSSLFRGFERILVGKVPSDALVYTPRICGICSVAQSVAAAQALAQAQGLTPTLNGQLVTNLILACENLADHLTHFYLFFMPDFAREVYQSQPWFSDTAQRFKAQSGSAHGEVLKARAEWLHITGILAGKWPHSLSIQAGGSTRALEAQEKLQLLLLIRQFRAFLERVVFVDQLEAVTQLSTADELNTWQAAHSNSDFGRFLQLANRLKLNGLGRGTDRFLSYGAYGQYFPQGVWVQGQIHALDVEQITEDISHSWMQAEQRVAVPFQGETQPHWEKQGAYSWCKAPRLNGKVVETGAIARQLVAQQPLITNLVQASGGNVATRVIARLLELARVVPVMEQWCQAIQIGEPFCAHASMPDEAQGIGMVEAARGSLGHWLTLQAGKIAHYQIIAPTTWNFSPRDELGQAGALEQALVGTPVEDTGAVKVQHIVRSFDPCMVCTVH
ncbi:nickel-dependent hydrogenase large subunit [uncultured Thiothrix sp.]|uniref:nickel-dependent hydrogenase large subunit n=1 Tax=uncultured Thiothrix sp. TaxID=223185 RepID=UPI00261E3FFF|nr:nickel-dependent hydrogenase large subunit [uncultured Thiothrix sp.]HMT93980.1 nickel-dependent hydrogenase large subunit [Thiolinea sp.]